MNPSTSAERSKPVDPRVPVIFGIGIGVFVLYLVTYAIRLHGQNDWYREVWPAYRFLFHGHVLEFLRTSPAYVGSLILRAPFVLVAHAFGAQALTSYFISTLPCLVVPALFAGYLAAHRTPDSRRATSKRPLHNLRPIDLFMVTPSAIVALSGGHPEDIVGSVLCVLAVLLALRGSGKAAGFTLGVAVINKSWALVIVPFLFAVMPADRRLSSFITLILTAGLVLIPVTVIRETGSAGAGVTGVGLGDQTAGVFVVPQLLWWFGSTSWIVREAHPLLVAVDWLVGAAWWWLRVRGRPQAPSRDSALMALALLFFLRGALDPWDNIYYMLPFLLTIMTYEDSPGFPRLSWLFTILIVLIVPLKGVLASSAAMGTPYLRRCSHGDPFLRPSGFLPERVRRHSPLRGRQCFAGQCAAELSTDEQLARTISMLSDRWSAACKAACWPWVPPRRARRHQG